MASVASPLPIDASVPLLKDTLARQPSAVLQAPPGAGKTTRVPLTLLDEPWLGGKRIVMLEPRRLAARAAAARMAESLGEEVGGTVGYRVRHDTRIGARTRVEVVTEGVLSRMVVQDPTLEGIGLVIFDEFHERNLSADTGLALTLQSQAVLRPDLRILVMSATLDGAPVAGLLGGAPIVTSEGRAFPVETIYVAFRLGTPLEGVVAGAVRRALDEQSGDILVFLPGVREIRRVSEKLEGVSADVIQLHGSLPPHLQNRALEPNAREKRRVVISTSIAETSLTIPGVRIVIDSGLARVPRYSPRTGMTRLATVRVSLASADQRRGRAGRLGPGVCYRLWSAHQERDLPLRATPEILEADLAPLALELAAAGVTDPDELSWLDPPPAASFAEARSLLVQLGAVGASGTISPHGRAMSRLAMHPRLAHMVLKGREMEAGRTACELAALLTERDVLTQQDSVPDADIRIRLDLLRGTTVRNDVNQSALRSARSAARACPGGSGCTEQVGLLLAFAYPERISRQRAGQPGKYLLRNGVGAAMEPQSLTGEEYIVAAELEGRSGENRILVAAPLSLEEIEEHFGEALESVDLIEWDGAARAVVARRRERLGALVIRESSLARPEGARVRAVLIESLRREGLAGLRWSEAAARLRQRVHFLRRLDPSWPDLSEEALAGSVEEWLGPHLADVRRMVEIERLELHDLLMGVVGWQRREELDRLAPTHLVVPSGSRVPVDYSNAEAPKVAVRLQEVFGLTETPRLGGRVPLTFHLLSPASRPVQVTRDLAGFWRTTYFEVRKDLKGRYPRHYWPEDPLRAEPTRYAKPRRGSGTRGD